MMKGNKILWQIRWVGYDIDLSEMSGWKRGAGNGNEWLEMENEWPEMEMSDRKWPEEMISSIIILTGTSTTMNVSTQELKPERILRYPLLSPVKNT